MDLNKFNTAMSNGDDVSSFQIASNIFVKQMVLNQPGNKIFGHSHAYSHVTLIATGSVWMRANGIEERHDAPKLVITPALVRHEFECIEPAILCCVHAIRQSEAEYDIADTEITPEQGLNFMGKFSLTSKK